MAYGEKLVDELFSHSKKMEKLYGVATELLGSGETKEKKFEKFVEVYKEHSAWFEKAKARLFKIFWSVLNIS